MFMRLIGAGLGLVLLWSTTAAAEWDKQQQSVWSSVESYWQLDAKGDSDGFMSWFDADYLGWNLGEPLPSDKAEVDKFVRYEHKATKILLYHLKPLAIKVHGDIAVVHYYYSTMRQDGEGKTRAVNGRWTDILKRQGNRWLLVADSGGRLDETDGN